MEVNGKHFQTVWMENGIVKMINQPLLPHQFEIVSYSTCADTANAITTMVVRGAGAIGATAGFAMAQAVREATLSADFRSKLLKMREIIIQTRPTAQNLFYAVNRVFRAVEELPPEKAILVADQVAQEIAKEDALDGENIGKIGAELISDGMRIMTHCNAGWLGFVDWGSALSPIYAASRQGKKLFVWVDETRPRLQGARLTSWELINEKIPHAIIADNAAGYFMQKGEVDMMIVGADRVALNGDVANKIGTFEKALLANYFRIPFYVAIPPSTIDKDCPDGAAIPIEERSNDEVLYGYGISDDGITGRIRLAPAQAAARNPAFDITPAALISGFITPTGIVTPDQIKDVI
ncbi:MAG: S-methyl-5-thioribose-1-phosphate isomerase [Anaerolineaceae bacterium]|nr:S-methyl-5-thioribose-1-phosphate isomerase [Anaerolineaceae bacterium]